MRKEGCGTLSQFVEKKAGLLSVPGTRTNFLGEDPISQANRFNCRKGKMIQVPRPASVDVYNRFMGGVGKADMLLSLYCSKMRSRKWYHRLVGYLVSVALINSFTV